MGQVHAAPYMQHHTLGSAPVPGSQHHTLGSGANEVVARLADLADPLLNLVSTALLALHHLQVRHPQARGTEHGHLRIAHTDTEVVG